MSERHSISGNLRRSSDFRNASDQCAEDINDWADYLCSKIREIQSKLLLDVQKRQNDWTTNSNPSHDVIGASSAAINEAYEEDTESSNGSQNGGYTKYLTFVKGDFDNDKLEEMFGHFEEKPNIPSFESKMKLISKFKCQIEGKVDVIIPANSKSTRNKAWVSNNKSPQDIHMMDGKGINSDYKKIPFAFESFGVDDNGDFLASHFNNKVIMRLKQNGKKVKFLDTSPQHPLGLHVKNGIVTVCLTDKWDFDAYKLAKRQIIQYRTRDGTVYREVRNSSTNFLFTMPYRVHVSDNGYICALDCKDKTEGRVVILDKYGQRSGIYSGHTKNSKFIPVDICCRTSQEVMVSDIGTKSVYLLNMSADLLGILLTDKLCNGSPTSLSLHSDNTIWVGNNSGDIHVFKYEIAIFETEQTETEREKSTHITYF